MTRSNAREIACHLVFEMNFNNITAGEALQTLMDDGYYPTRSRPRRTSMRKSQTASSLNT